MHLTGTNGAVFQGPGTGSEQPLALRRRVRGVLWLLVSGIRISRGLPEDVVDDGGLLAFARAEVAGGGFDGGEPEQGLDLGGVGTALAQAGGVGMAAAMRPQAGDAGVVAGGKDDLDNAGDSQRGAAKVSPEPAMGSWGLIPVGQG